MFQNIDYHICESITTETAPASKLVFETMNIFIKVIKSMFFLRMPEFVAAFVAGSLRHRDKRVAVNSNGMISFFFFAKRSFCFLHQRKAATRRAAFSFRDFFTEPPVKKWSKLDPNKFAKSKFAVAVSFFNGPFYISIILILFISSDKKVAFVLKHVLAPAWYFVSIITWNIFFPFWPQIR